MDGNTDADADADAAADGATDTDAADSDPADADAGGEPVALELRFFATFREAVGQKVVERTYPRGATVGDVLRDLEASYDGLAGEILEDGEIRPQVNVLANGRGVQHLDGLGTELDDGDALSVFPPVAGG